MTEIELEKINEYKKEVSVYKNYAGKMGENGVSHHFLLPTEKAKRFLMPFPSDQDIMRYMEKEDETFFIQLGLVVHHFSIVEHLIGALITRLISEDPKIGTIMVSQMSFKNRLDAFSCLMKYRYPLSDIKELIKTLSDAEDRRNQIIHSLYCTRDPNISAPQKRIKITTRRNGGLKYNETDVSPDKLKQLSSDLVTLIKQIQKLHQSLFPKKMIKM